MKSSKTPDAEQSSAWGGKHWIRDEKRAAIYERDGWSCVYCGRDMRAGRTRRQVQIVLSLDHLIPRCQGGDNSAHNVVTACLTCNSSRGARAWRDFAPGGAQERIEWLIEQPLDIELGKAIVASLAGHEVEGLR